jgi:hypothetical protein
MYSRLNLSIDKKVAEEAKKYARNQGRSLSDLVESYFKFLISDEPVQNLNISPKIKALKGALKVPEDYDYKKELAKALTKKYRK